MNTVIKNGIPTITFDCINYKSVSDKEYPSNDASWPLSLIKFFEVTTKTNPDSVNDMDILKAYRELEFYPIILLKNDQGKVKEFLTSSKQNILSDEQRKELFLDVNERDLTSFFACVNGEIVVKGESETVRAPIRWTPTR